MPYWYYAGKTTTCIDLPSKDDHRILIPTVIIPRQRFHAPRASVHYLLNTKPPQIKLLPDPPAPKPEPPAPTVEMPTKQREDLVKATTPETARDDETTTRFDLAEHAKAAEDENSTDGVLASSSSDVEAGEADSPRSEGATSDPEKEPSSSSRKKRGRRGRGSSSD